MSDLESFLRAAWHRIRPRLLRDPDELRRRLARRRLAIMQRPPRAWCIALRASDRRIDDTTAIIEPVSDPAPISHPSSFRLHPSSQRLTLSYADLRLLTWPITLAAPGEPADEVAKKLGTTPSGLINARLKNRFHTHHVKHLAGRRGRPVPVLFTRDELDPNARDFAPADPLWGWTAKYLADRLDEQTFHPQTLTRIPIYRPISDIYRRLRAQSPEQAEREPRRPSRKLPPPEPDHVWYKWSTDNHYLGDDYRFWRKTPNDPGDWQAAARAAEAAALKKRAKKILREMRQIESDLAAAADDDAVLSCAADAPHRGMGAPPMQPAASAAESEEAACRRERMGEAHMPQPNPPPRRARSRNTVLFRGHAWLCPACHKTCRTLYYPVPPPPLDRYLTPPPGSKGSKKLARLIADDETVDANHPDQIPRPLPAFACYKCHRIRFFSRVCRSAWDHFIAHISGGLLYGSEVEKPSWLTPDRKHKYKPQLNRAPSKRRQEVLERWIKGHSRARIALDLSTGVATVCKHVAILYRQYNVHDRFALIQAVGGTTKLSRTPRRDEVLKRLLAGQSYQQIAKEMNITKQGAHTAANRIYRAHNVHSRAALQWLHHVPAEPSAEENRAEVARRLAAGQSCAQIARETGRTYAAVHHDKRKLRRADKAKETAARK